MSLASSIRYTLSILKRRLRRPRESIFRTIHRDRLWGDGSVSGAGSELEQTARIREALPALFEELGVRILLDAPCGDLHWLRHVELDLEHYHGVDVVPELIEENRRRFADERRTFQVADIARDPLPRADLILCRDCLVHLSSRNVRRCLANFRRSGSTYLLTTTYPGAVRRNRTILDGMWRPLDLEKPPFRLPPPLRLISEETTEADELESKSLGLWRLSELPP